MVKIVKSLKNLVKSFKSFTYWIKGRKSAPKKDKDIIKWTNISNTPTRERFVYIGAFLLIVFIASQIIISYPVYNYTPQELRPDTIIGIFFNPFSDGQVVIPKDSYYGAIFNNKMSIVTMDLTEVPKYESVAVKMDLLDFDPKVDHSVEYREEMYNFLKDEVKLDEYKSRLFSYMAWSFGESEDRFYQIWYGIFKPLGYASKDVLKWTFGDTWDIFEENYMTVSWHSYFRLFFFFSFAIAILGAYYVDPVRRRATARVMKYYPGKGQWIYEPEEKSKHVNIFGIKVPKRVTSKSNRTFWVSDTFSLFSSVKAWICLVLMVLVWFVIFYYRMLVNYPRWESYGEVVFGVLFLITIISLIITYKSRYPAGRPKGRGRPKKIEELAEKRGQLLGRRTILGMSESPSAFSNLDWFTKDEKGINKPLVEQMAESKTRKVSPFGEYVDPEIRKTKGGSERKGYFYTWDISGKDKEGKNKHDTLLNLTGGDGVLYFNSNEEKESFKKMYDEVKRDINKMKTKGNIKDDVEVRNILGRAGIDVSNMPANERALELALLSQRIRYKEDQDRMLGSMGIPKDKRQEYYGKNYGSKELDSAMSRVRDQKLGSYTMRLNAEDYYDKRLYDDINRYLVDKDGVPGFSISKDSHGRLKSIKSTGKLDSVDNLIREGLVATANKVYDRNGKFIYNGSYADIDLKNKEGKVKATFRLSKGDLDKIFGSKNREEFAESIGYKYDVNRGIIRKTNYVDAKADPQALFVMGNAMAKNKKIKGENFEVMMKILSLLDKHNQSWVRRKKLVIIPEGFEETYTRNFRPKESYESIGKYKFKGNNKKKSNLFKLLRRKD